MEWDRYKESKYKLEAKIHRYQKAIMAFSEVPKENKEAIIRFDNRLQCGYKSRINYMVAFKCFLKHAPYKEFQFYKRDDFNNWLKVLELRYKPNTATSYIDDVERLFQFVLDLEEDETPPCMKGIKRPRIDLREREQRLSENLLDKSQILKLIRMTSNKKYQAIIMTGFDGALRKSEIMNIYIKEDMEIFEDHIVLTVRDSKGGTTDPVTLVDSVPYIKAWLSEHPFYVGENTPLRTPLWPRDRIPLYKNVEIDGQKTKKIFPLKPWIVEWILSMLTQKAGIKRKIWPHLLRHSKISSMLNDEGYTISEVQHHARHRSIASTMLYLHLKKNHNLKNKMLEKAGKLKIDKKVGENPFKPILCQRCSEENVPTNKFCLRCGWDFSKDLRQVKMEDEKEILAKNFMTFIANNPEASEFLKGMMNTFLDQKSKSENPTAAQAKETQQCARHQI